MKKLELLLKSNLDLIVKSRANETKIGEVATFGSLNASDSNLKSIINSLKTANKKYIILGIEEDVGIRANFGRAGASDSWKAFLDAFLNAQSNSYLSLDSVHLLGVVQTEDLIKKANKATESELRSICNEVDDRVSLVISEIVTNGLIPIVIGGGHNNSFGILKGIGKNLSVANLDFHLDFRALEGRHSGNPFSYAHSQGFLSKYYVIGAGEQSNSKEMIERFKSSGFKLTTYEDIAIRQSVSFADTIKAAQAYLDDEIGLELDLDTIANIPSSAGSLIGFSVEDACFYIHSLASNKKILYLHLPEGAPQLGGTDGARSVGRTLSLLVQTFIKSSSK